MRSLFKWLQRATAPTPPHPTTPGPQATPTTKAMSIDPKLADFIMNQHLQQQAAESQKTRFEWSPGRFTVGDDLAGMSLSGALASRFAMPKPYFSKLVAWHEVQVERVVGAGELRRIGYHQGLKVKSGDVVSLTTMKIPERDVAMAVDWYQFEQVPEEEREGHLRRLILHEDDRIMIINKPSGLAVQMGANCKTSVDRLFPKEINPELRLVHRLDKDASGALILAKSGEVASDLRQRLDDAQIDPQCCEKVYWTMCVGKPEMALGEIYSNIYAVGRFPTERMSTHHHLRRSVLDAGKPAITQWRHLGTYIKKHASGRRVKLSMLEMRPLTGRKHQLRVHCAEQLSMAILGDAKYGFDKLKGACVSARPLHLHCYQITLRGWLAGGGDLVVTAPLPQHWLRTMTDYPLFLPERPKLRKPQFRTNVRPMYDRFMN